MDELYKFNVEHSNINGQCFFKIISEYLTKLTPSNPITVQHLKTDCLKYVNENQWVKNVVFETAKTYYGKSNSNINEIWQHYTLALKYDATQVCQMESSSSLIEKIMYKSIVMDEYRNICLDAICGRLHIEGKILQEIYDIKFILIDGDDGVPVTTNTRTIYLIKAGLNHFAEYTGVHTADDKQEKGAAEALDNQEEIKQINAKESFDRYLNLKESENNLALNNLGALCPSKSDTKNIEIEDPNVCGTIDSNDNEYDSGTVTNLKNTKQPRRKNNKNKKKSHDKVESKNDNQTDVETKEINVDRKIDGNETKMDAAGKRNKRRSNVETKLNYVDKKMDGNETKMDAARTSSRRGNYQTRAKEEKGKRTRDSSMESVQSNASSRYSSASNLAMIQPSELNIFGASDAVNRQYNMFYDAEMNIDSRMNNKRQMIKISAGISYDGFLNGNQFDGNGKGKISNEFDKREFIEGIYRNSCLVKLKQCALVFQINKTVSLFVRIYGEDNLLTINRCLVARVKFNQFDIINWNQSFKTIGMQLLDKVTIEKMLEDGSMERKNFLIAKLLEKIQRNVNTTTVDKNSVNMYLGLGYITGVPDLQLNNNKYLLERLVASKLCSKPITNLCAEILQEEHRMISEAKTFPKLLDFRANADQNLLSKIKEICTEAKENHMKTLLSIFNPNTKLIPSTGLNELNDYQIFYLHPDNINIFNSIEMALPQENQSVWIEILSNLWANFIGSIKKMTITYRVDNIPPLSHRIYLPLFKIFVELANDISEITTMSLHDILVRNLNGVKLVDKIKFPQQNFVNKAVQLQINFVLSLMNHFQPGVMPKPFVYTLFFKKPGMNAMQANDLIKGLAEDQYVWMYILDNTLSKLMYEIPKETKTHYYQLSYTLIECLIGFLRRNSKRQESVRLVVSNIIKFMAKISPYISKIDLNTTIDQHILQKQIDFLTFTMTKDQPDRLPNYLSNVIDVYGTYWNNRDKVIAKLPTIYACRSFANETDSIYQLLLTIVKNAVDALMEKGITMETFVTFMRAYNEFVEDLDDIEYKWYVKGSDFRSMPHLKLVANKLADEEKCSFLVCDVPAFISYLKGINRSVPKNDVTRILIQLLVVVNNSLLKNEWPNGEEILFETRIQLGSQLLSAIRCSFLYLKEQPDYRDFDLFYEESTKPFHNVLNESKSKEDFEKRCAVIKESFWYIRKQNEIGIEEALNLYEKKNAAGTFDRVLMRQTYLMYQKQFNEFINDYHMDKSMDRILQYLKNQIVITDNAHEWTMFKMKTLPSLLAGLAAIWSIQQSKDISTKEKALKPHCIQIICIFRLFNVDSQRTMMLENHLAEVLTGQGKSLVLALTAAVFSLLKYDVKIICYSEYLSLRDHDSFKQFFKTFNFPNSIVYETFKEMANDLLKINKNGTSMGIRDLVKNDILGGGSHSAFEMISNKIRSFTPFDKDNYRKTILLIDEVDVFFMDRFFGQTYNSGTLINMETIQLIQERIWKLVNDGMTIEKQIYREVEMIITHALRSKTDKTFCDFYNKTAPSRLYGTNQKNSEFLKKEIDIMIQNAKFVFTDSSYFKDQFYLNGHNVIIYKNEHGEIDNSIWQYYNVFNYFRLKKNNFDTINFKNYGYLQLLSGKISYAKLPIEYSSILGVTGTLSTLSNYQKSAIHDMYNIKWLSLMPSFYGPSNIKWNPIQDTKIEKSESDWLQSIFMKTNTIIQANRAVLICFDTETEMGLFEQKYSDEIAFLNKLTVNTINKEFFINEAGVKKNVTLLTRGMGRGTDFKTSVTVEKNGGCHVIQTFFSAEENEEIQIRGRTARKDNKGSYELILCRTHLELLGYVNVFGYSGLSAQRRNNMESKNDAIKAKIQNCDEEHKKTMKYLKELM